MDVSTSTNVLSKGAVEPQIANSAYRYYALALLCLVMVLSWTDRQVFAIVLEKIKADLHLGDTELGVLGGLSFGIFYASLGLPIAMVADRVGRRRVIVAALALWSLATCWCGAASGFATLFLARMSVGVGEAGGSPSAQALVAEYFPEGMRGRALGVLFLHVPIGYAISYALGGHISDLYGWRETFLIFGAPGALLAVIVALTLREPGHDPGSFAPSPSIGIERPTRLHDSPLVLLRSPALRHIIIGGTVFAIGTFGASVWLPAFFIRTHGMTAAMAGSRLAVVILVTGGLGAFAGGAIADHLIRNRESRSALAWLPMTWILVTIPFSVATLLLPSARWALLAYAVQSLANQLLLAPLVASLQQLAGPNQRAQSAALYLLAVNLIAASLGPMLIGYCSQHLFASFHADSLRYAMLAVLPVTALWGAGHFLAAGRNLARWHCSPPSRWA